jgi:hypothetical protein
VGATAATLDPPGYYTDQPGSVAPIPAPPGSYVDTVRATAPTLASPGYFVPTAGTTQQTPASPSYYVPTAGATQPIPDPPGTYSGFAATTYSLINPDSPSGGHGTGFWRNASAQAFETLTDFSALTALNLRTASGANEDFTSSLSADRTALSDWLSHANAANMAYKLSAQLAVTELNVLHGDVNANAYVDVNLISSALIAALNSGPNPNLVSPYGVVQITALIDAANPSLGINGDTKGPSAARTYQQALADVLSAINNNWAITFVLLG